MKYSILFSSIYILIFTLSFAEKSTAQALSSKEFNSINSEEIDYKEFQGIKIATKRRVYVRLDDNTPLLPEPLLVSIDLSEIELK